MHNEIHNTIAMQLHHMKPDEYVPQFDVTMEVVDDNAIGVIVRPTDSYAVVRYDAGADHYDVTITKDDDGPKHIQGVYCDQLGEIVFGDKAKNWTLPFFQITDEDGNVIAEG